MVWRSRICSACWRPTCKRKVWLRRLTESAETLAIFPAMCLMTGWFSLLAYGFAARCAVTAVTRIVAGIQVVKPD